MDAERRWELRPWEVKNGQTPPLSVWADTPSVPIPRLPVTHPPLRYRGKDILRLPRSKAGHDQ